MTEADEHRHKMQCLAREVLNMRSPDGDYAKMKRWLGRYEKRHGKKAAEELKEYLRAEKDRQDTESQIARNKRDVEFQQKLHGERV